MTVRVLSTSFWCRVGENPRLFGYCAAVLAAILCASPVFSAAPVFDSLTATPPAVLPGSISLITLEANDPDCPDVCVSGCGQIIRADLTYWSATGGTFVVENDGASQSPYGASAQWQAPLVEGIYEITVRLGDNGGFACGGRQYTTQTIDVVVSTVITEPPVVESVTADPAVTFPGEQSQLECIATDPEGGDIDYSWETDLGSVTPGGNGTATFTSNDVGIATITCTAVDPDGGVGTDQVTVGVSAAHTEKALRASVKTPQRLDVASWGDLFVADRSAGGINVVNLFSGQPVYRLPIADVTSVAVTWDDDLLIAAAESATVFTRRGDVLLELDPGEALGKISDVAVDSINRRYGVLYRKTGRIVVFDEFGFVVVAFGATGDGADQFKSPHGLAAGPSGEWYVADTGHGEIKSFSATGVYTGAFGGLGGDAGEFVNLDDVAVDGHGIVYASDSFQDWIVSFESDGSPREVFGTYGDGDGQFKTATGIAPFTSHGRIVAASLNGSALQVFLTTNDLPTSVPAPSALIVPEALSFGSFAIGVQSPPQTVALTNAGDAPLGIRGVQVGTGFTQTNDCRSFLDPGEFCSFSISLLPTRVGQIDGSLVVDTSASDGGAVVALSGAGYAPATAILSPSALVFAGQRVGTTSSPQTITLLNTGSEPLSIGSVSTSGDYGSTSSCGGVLAGGASCAIDVVFSPLNPGAHVPGGVTVVSNAAGSPHSVVLDGEALDPLGRLTIDDVTVSEGGAGLTSAVFTVTLTGFSPDTVTVDFSAVSETAVEGEDFESAVGTLVFSEGVTRRTVEVTVLDDTILEADEETFILELANPVNAILDRTAGVGAIVDDELCQSPDLLVNGDGEGQFDGSAIPGWRVTAGDWRMGSIDPVPYHGASYLAAGAAEYAEIEQTIDVGAFAESIDADRQEFGFESFVRTDSVDVARVVLEYLDADGAVLSSLDSLEISSPLGWTRVSDFRIAPPQTRGIRVRLIGRGFGDGPTDAYFDYTAVIVLRVPTVWIDDVALYEGDVGSGSFKFTARMSCGYHREVSGRVWTSDGSALAGEDFLAADVPLIVPSGTTGVDVPVTVLGDTADEDHEVFGVNLSVEDGGAVAILGSADGVIVNDDFCQRDAAYWAANSHLWPTDTLELGRVTYDQATLLWLLSYAGSDVSHELASELIATKLNLFVGSDPVIVPKVNESDDFLAQYPPGSQPGGHAKQTGRELTEILSLYNSEACP